jgi:phosphoribosylaminoimidazolecarboxamide formyltransferase/IMP cyclohydrolase
MKRALLSVYDKTGLIVLARVLDRCGVELVASGGTARSLEENGLVVKSVEEMTSFPELIGGRVKTLHPAIHAGILARRSPDHLAELASHNLRPIDLVVVNLYPFEQTVAREGVTLDQAIEQIDIGGVALLRAVAKNYEWVTVLSDPTDYAEVGAQLERDGDTAPLTRARLALKAFRRTASYDAAIAEYFVRQAGSGLFPESLVLPLEKIQDLRYGENPHQGAALYRLANQPGIADARQLHGKALSFTNWLDVDAAWADGKRFR